MVQPQLDGLQIAPWNAKLHAEIQQNQYGALFHSPIQSIQFGQELRRHCLGVQIENLETQIEAPISDWKGCV